MRTAPQERKETGGKNRLNRFTKIEIEKVPFTGFAKRKKKKSTTTKRGGAGALFFPAGRFSGKRPGKDRRRELCENLLPKAGLTKGGGGKRENSQLRERWSTLTPPGQKKNNDRHVPNLCGKGGRGIRGKRGRFHRKGVDSR